MSAEAAVGLAPVTVVETGPPVSKVPKVLGVVDIVLASLWMLMALQSLAGFLLMPIIMPQIERMMNWQNQWMETLVERERQEDLDRLAERERAATDPVEIESLQKAREAILKREAPKPMDFKKLMDFWGTPTMLAWTFSDKLSGLAVDAMLLWAGILLVKYRERGRKLGLWTAGLAIARTIVIWSWWIFFLAPLMARHFSTVVAEMMPRENPPPGMPNMEQVFGWIYGIMFTAQGVVTLGLGMIFPAICLYLLTRPRVVEATRGPLAAAQP